LNNDLNIIYIINSNIIINHFMIELTWNVKQWINLKELNFQPPCHHCPYRYLQQYIIYNIFWFESECVCDTYLWIVNCIYEAPSSYNYVVYRCITYTYNIYIYIYYNDIVTLCTQLLTRNRRCRRTYIIYWCSLRGGDVARFFSHRRSVPTV